MNARLVLRLAPAALLALALVSAPDRAARAACSYYPIAPGTTYTFPGPLLTVANQTSPAWSLFATRGASNFEDWDLRLYQNTGAEPGCVSNLLASSSYGAGIVDFVLADGTHNAPGNYYPALSFYSGPLTLAYFRWHDTAGELLPNHAHVLRRWTPADVAEVWTIPLTAGVTYSVYFHGQAAGIPWAGPLMLFRNPGTGSYFTTRSQAVFSTKTNLNAAFYTPSVTGLYAIVVPNDSAHTGDFDFAIGTCTTQNLALRVPVTTSKDYAFFTFSPLPVNWGSVGASGSGFPTVGVNTSLGTNPSDYPECLNGSNWVGYSNPPTSTHSTFVIGDYTHSFLGPLAVEAMFSGGPPGGAVEWSGSSGTITPNANATPISLDATDFLRTYDLSLTGGQTYTFTLDQATPAVHAMLFRNAAGGVYYAGRGAAVLDVTGCTSWMAPSTGVYGLVLVNDSQAAATGSFGVTTTPCSCPTAITRYMPQSLSAADGYYKFTPEDEHWIAVAARGTTTSDDYDLEVYGSPNGGASPACFDNLIVSSDLGGGSVDIGVMDFHSMPVATSYVHAHRYSGASGVVEFAPETHQLTENGEWWGNSFNSGQLAYTGEANLVAGTTYQIETFATAGSGGKFLVFENTTGGAYAVTRSHTALAITSNGVTNYTPAHSGWHAIVFVNDQSADGYFQVRYGRCTAAVALAADTPVAVDHGYDTYSFLAPANGWTAVGEGQWYSNRSIEVGTATGASFPNCVTGGLAASARPGDRFVNFVVGDFFHNTPGTYYAAVQQTSANTLMGGRAGWSPGTTMVTSNDNNTVTGTLDGADVLHSYSVYLVAGRSYNFYLSHTGTAVTHMLLFRNLAGGTYWAPRDSACLEVIAGGSKTYGATMSGYYGIVVVCDDQLADTYTLGVYTCWSPYTLTSGVSRSVTPADYAAFTQSYVYWTAVGVRSTSDWDIEVNSSATGANPPVCQSGPLASSNVPGVVDFVVGDFNTGANATGTYFLRTYRYSGTGSGVYEWDSGAQQVGVTGGATRRTTGALDVLEIWDVRLTAGQAYTVSFFRTPGLDAKVLLFRNPTGGPYWAGRGAAVYTNTTTGTYTAPTSGYYGLVVVNDNGAEGQYDVGVAPSGVGAEPLVLPAVTALRGVQPNPARGSVRIDYALREAGAVRLEALDLAGRVVARIDGAPGGPGEWSASWDGRAPNGHRAPPGLYMVRLVLDGRIVGQRKLALLD